MVYCVEARLAFSTATRRNNVLTAIQTRINTKPRWSVDIVEAMDLRPRIGVNGLRLALRFVLRADAQDLQTRMGELFPANPPIAGSWMTAHDCSHDEGTNSCTVTATQTW